MFFDFFKKDKSYYSCKCLEETVILHRNWYSICSMYGHPNHIYRPLFRWENDRFDYKKFLKSKRNIIKNNKKGIIHKGCIGCKDLEKHNWTGKCDKLYHIHFRLSVKCNAKCVYCGDNINNNAEDRLFFEDLKKLVEKGILAKNALIEYGGGEFTLHKEFDKIFRYLLDNGYRRYKIYTSCLRYSNELAEALGYGQCELIVSADAGDRETFMKIKQADTYDRLWGNLQKYVNAQNENKQQVKIKMIFLKGINDNKEQINAFLSKVKDIGAQLVAFDYETQESLKLQESPDVNEIKYLFKLLKYAEKITKEKYELSYHFHLNVETLIKKYPEIYASVE